MSEPRPELQPRAVLREREQADGGMENVWEEGVFPRTIHIT